MGLRLILGRVITLSFLALVLSISFVIINYAPSHVAAQLQRQHTKDVVTHIGNDGKIQVSILKPTAVTNLIPGRILALSVYAYDQTGMKNAAQVNNSTITNSTSQVRDNVIVEKRQLPPVGGKLTPDTISAGNNSNGQILTTQMVAKQLATMDSDKIANFPLKDVSPTDLVTVFSSISPAVLEKTLSSISDSDLATILNKISIDKRQQILDRLSPDKKQDVLDRLSGQLFK